MTRAILTFAFLGLAACGGDGGGTEACTEGDYACSGTVLQQCTDGALVDVEDCAAEGLECMADMGHCGDPNTMTDDTGAR